MERAEIRSVFNELKNEFRMPKKTRLEIRPMKTKAASVSIRKNTVRLNRNLISWLDRNCIEYLILHELIHLKLRSIHHSNDFYKIIYSVMEEKELREAERKILASLLKLNSKSIAYLRSYMLCEGGRGGWNIS